MRKTHAAVKAAAVFHREPNNQHYGYEITRKSGVRSGVLYPVLARMVDSGWLSSRWEIPEDGSRPRCYYRLTDPGREQIAAYLTEARMDSRFAGMGL